MIDFSEKVTKLRKESGLTQKECAERSGVGLRFLRELEQGKPTVRLDKVNKVLQLFGKKTGIINEHE